MEKLIITCNPDNFPSRKTCEHIGAKLNAIVDLPSHNDMLPRGREGKMYFRVVIIELTKERLFIELHHEAAAD